MIKLFDSKSIRSVFLRHVLPLLLSILMLGTLSMGIIASYISRSTRESTENALIQASGNFDMILGEMDALSLMLGGNPDIIFNLKSIQNYSSMNYNLFREFRLIKSFLSSSVNSRLIIEKIYLYVDNANNFILSSENGFELLDTLEIKPWLEEYMAYDEEPEKITVARTGDLIRFARPINSMNQGKTGAIIIDIKSSSVIAYFDYFLNHLDAHLEICNEKGNLLFAAGNVSRWALTVTGKSETYGWSYTVAFPYLKLYAPVFTIFCLILIASLIVILFGFVFTYKTNQTERAFINYIVTKLAEAGAEDIEPVRRENIFDTLNELIIEHFLEHDYQKVRTSAIEYRALQLQINPHFLFNTLDNIYWKAVKVTGGENDLSNMVKLLSDLMKYSLTFDSQEGIPLARELDAVDKYIRIQHYRFRDAFTFTTEIDEKALDMHLPSMILQPILENAFNHGFREDKVLNICLKAEKREGLLKLEITNDGQPFDETLLERLQIRDFSALRKSSSLGLKNTIERLDLFYKGAAEITFRNAEGIVSVLIEIPEKNSPYPKAGE